MDSQRKILILFAGFGDGHVQVAKALQRSFSKRGQHRVIMLDLLAETHPLINRISRFFYIKSSTHLPQLYGWSYYATEHMKYDGTLARALNSIGMMRFKQLIETEKPDVVINTFPFMTMAELRKHTGNILPIFTVLTDFALHYRWLHPEVDKYFVATSDLKKKMIGAGIAEDRIKVSGIPLRAMFEEGKPRNRKRKYSAMETRTQHVLVMAGAFGVMRNLRPMIERLLTPRIKRIVVVCGKNEKLREATEKQFKDEPRVRVLGFVEQIKPLMEASLCMVTKAGGITLSEAIALQIPVIVYRPLPGQEKENAEYLANKGAVRIAGNLSELAALVDEWVTDDYKLRTAKERIGRLRTKDASATVVDDILREIKHWKPTYRTLKISAAGKGRKWHGSVRSRTLLD